jgi:hypothetical protein
MILKSCDVHENLFRGSPAGSKVTHRHPCRRHAWLTLCDVQYIINDGQGILL